MLHIAIPLLDELNNIPKLLKSIAVQKHSDFKVYFCVNQADEWWNEPTKLDICKRNQESIKLISQSAAFPYRIIDKSSPGKGWKGKQIGVGWARKTLIDHILSQANKYDIIISLDADTYFSADYFHSIEDKLKKHPKAPAIAIPYYHPLSKSRAEDRAMLRYEIYMRHYLISLFRIKSPYAFSALGSAIAMPVWAIQKIGGITPKKSGEDFYLLQKMVKFRPILQWNTERVYPAARFSDRVFFGTGPAMIKGNQGDWSSYPIYPTHLFDAISEFYDLIPHLYIENIDTPIDSVFGNSETCHGLWNQLRKNNKDLPHFTKAVHDKFDGLRILQFLKQHPDTKNNDDSKSLLNFINKNEESIEKPLLNTNFSLQEASTSQLNEIRDYLCKIEDLFRQQADKNYGA